MAYREKTDAELKKYLPIGEIIKELKEEPHTIRFWEDQFFLSIHRSSKGYREYSAEDFDKIREIHRLLRVELYTIEGAKRQLRLAKRGQLVNCGRLFCCHKTPCVAHESVSNS